MKRLKHCSAASLVLVRIGLIGTWLVAGAVPARADATVFVGAMTAGSAKPAVGWSFGRCPSIVGFEIEYAWTLGPETPTSSSAGGVNFNIIVQSSSPIHGFQFFAIAGLGLYGESGSGPILAKGMTNVYRFLGGARGSTGAARSLRAGDRAA